MTIDSQEDIRDSKCGPLIAVHERMVLDKAFQKRCRLMNAEGSTPQLRALTAGKPDSAPLARAALQKSRRIIFSAAEIHKTSSPIRSAVAPKRDPHLERTE